MEKSEVGGVPAAPRNTSYVAAVGILCDDTGQFNDLLRRSYVSNIQNESFRTGLAIRRRSWMLRI